MRSHPKRISSADTGLHSGQIEELVRFMRRLDLHSDPEQLARSLTSELTSFVVSNTTALIVSSESSFSRYVVDNEGLPIDQHPLMEFWKDGIYQFLAEQSHPLVISSLDQEVKFHEAVRFFLDRGNQSVCVFPLATALRRLGTLCFARVNRDAFSDNEIPLLSLISDYVALAIDDSLNFAHSESVRAQLENERKKLQLIINLNNSVVSNLELREVLRAVSPGIRKTMRLDGVALILPDAPNRQLRLYELDFPDSKGTLSQNMSKTCDSSPAGQVFRTGKPWIGNIEEFHRSEEHTSELQSPC